jgi:hypothetical protein
MALGCGLAPVVLIETWAWMKWALKPIKVKRIRDKRMIMAVGFWKRKLYFFYDCGIQCEKMFKSVNRLPHFCIEEEWGIPPGGLHADFPAEPAFRIRYSSPFLQ